MPCRGPPRASAPPAEAICASPRPERQARRLETPPDQAGLGWKACATPGSPARRTPLARLGTFIAHDLTGLCGRIATGSISTRHRACRLISISARSARTRSGPCRRARNRLRRRQCRSRRRISILRELGWREFSYHLLHHFPTITDEPLRPEFADLPWRDDQPRSPPGRRARPVTPSSTPPCASFGTRASCTTGRA